jgi:hypothetical protein
MPRQKLKKKKDLWSKVPHWARQPGKKAKSEQLPKLWYLEYSKFVRLSGV